MRSRQSTATAAMLFALAIAGCSNNDDNDTPVPAPMQPTPAPAPAPGDTFGLTSANRLVTFNRAAPSVRTAIAITGLQSGEQLLGIDIRPGGTPAGELYAVGSTGRIYTINTTSGAVTQKSVLAADSTDSTNPFTALDGADFGVDFNPKLISFNNATPQKLCTSAAIAGLQNGENVLGIDTRPADGALYAVGSTGRVYTIDTTTAAATLKSTLVADSADATDPFTALDGSEFGVDFNPVPDRLRVVSNTRQNLRINVDTGATFTDTKLNPGAAGATAAAYTNSFAGAGATTLYAFDVANDRLMIQGQPSGDPNKGDLQPVGPLGIDVQAATGFDISGVNNAAFAAVTPAAATTSELHTINLTSGAATRVNAIGGGERVRGLTLNTNPRATLLGVTTDNRLVTFKTTTPGTLDTNVAVTGLQGGETIVGIDIRPANGRLYAVTDAARVYTLDATTGAATMAGMLTADAADPTNPFAMLSGAAFGVDFNPMADRLRIVSDADRLRIVSDARQNLRIVPGTGAVTTDGDLDFVAPDVVAAAYTQNFARAPSTRLLGIDATTGTLQQQSPPNDGILTTLGRLDATLMFGPTAGFDIAGGDDGLSLAVLQPMGAAQSTLYRVNPKTGAAMALGAIGPAGTAPLRGFAIRLQ